MNDQEITIYIPTVDDAESEDFYKNKVLLKERYEGIYEIPYSSTLTRLVLMKVENIIKSPVPICSYYVKDNFLTYCDGMYKKGVDFEFFMETPGGYTVSILDPSRNILEIHCKSFKDENSMTIDTKPWG